MMRTLAIVLALASTALASPALARDKSWYVGIEGGGMIVEDIDYDITGTRTGVASVDHDYGYDVDGVMGYDFGGFRLETEVGYRRATVDGFSSTTLTNTGIGAGTVPAGSYSYAGGSTSALSFMLNGLLDFGADDGIQGFVGGAMIPTVFATTFLLFPGNRRTQASVLIGLTAAVTWAIAS